MEADWSVEAGAEDATVVVPWASGNAEVCFIDLRAEPGRISSIAEVSLWPELRDALLALNSRTAAVWTAKCDVWHLDEDERARVSEAVESDATQAGMASYMDVSLRAQPTAGDTFPLHEAWARSLARAAAEAPFPQVLAEFVVRPALVHGQPTFAITAYLYALGETAEAARQAWSEALAWTAAALDSTARPIGTRPDATMRGAGE